MPLFTDSVTSQQKVTLPVEQTTEKPAVSQGKPLFGQLSDKINSSAGSMTQTYPSANRKVDVVQKATIPSHVYSSQDMKEIGLFAENFYNFIQHQRSLYDVRGKVKEVADNLAETNTVKFKLKAILGRLLAAFGNTDFQVRQQKAAEDLKEILTDSKAFAWLEKFIRDPNVDIKTIQEGVRLMTGLSAREIREIRGQKYSFYLANLFNTYGSKSEDELGRKINDKFVKTLDTMIDINSDYSEMPSLQKKYVGMCKDMWGSSFIPLLKIHFQELDRTKQDILCGELSTVLSEKELVDFLQSNMTDQQKKVLIRGCVSQPKGNAWKSLFRQNVLNGVLSVKDYHIYLTVIKLSEEKKLEEIQNLAQQALRQLSSNSDVTDEQIKSIWGVIKSVIPPEELVSFLQNNMKSVGFDQNKNIIQMFQIGVLEGALTVKNFKILSSTILRTIPTEEWGTFLAKIYPNMVQNGGSELFQELAKEALRQIHGIDVEQYNKLFVNVLTTIQPKNWEFFLTKAYPNMPDVQKQEYLQSFAKEVLIQLLLKNATSSQIYNLWNEIQVAIPGILPTNLVSKINEKQELFQELLVRLLSNPDVTDEQINNLWAGMQVSISFKDGETSFKDGETFLQNVYSVLAQNGKQELFLELAIKAVKHQPFSPDNTRTVVQNRWVTVLRMMPPEEMGTFLAKIYPDIVKNGGSELFQDLAKEALAQLSSNSNATDEQMNNLWIEVLRTIPSEEWKTFLTKVYPEMSDEQKLAFIQDAQNEIQR